MPVDGPAAEFVAVEPRRILEDADARACLAATAAAGISAVEWCRDNAVDGRSLNAWRINLERRDHAFVELVAATPPPLSTPTSARYMLEIGEVRLHRPTTLSPRAGKHDGVHRAPLIGHPPTCPSPPTAAATAAAKTASTASKCRASPSTCEAPRSLSSIACDDDAACADLGGSCSTCDDIAGACIATRAN